MKQNTIDSISVKPRRYVAEIATRIADIRAALALRHRVFAGEMGATLHSLIDGLDVDEIDIYCDHLIVREVQTGDIVGCTRLLPDSAAARLGRFYSEGEFLLDGVLALPGRFLEIGRTCVDPTHRGSVVLSVLWNGLARYVRQHRFDYLMGCASLSPGPNGFAVEAVYRQISPDQLGPTTLGVQPRVPVPKALRCERDESGIPPLLQAYLRQGCWVCGEPCWDQDFNVMDVFILLELSRLHERYEKRFIIPHTEVVHDVMSVLV